LTQETDVLDTWFSSALWPFSTMGWPESTGLLKAFYPTSCLVTGFDILFFWVARMMMMGLKFMDDVPFRDVYIHALVRDEHGKKMSKSLGNVIDPLMVMDKFGTDAFRFTLAALAAQGRDIRLSENRIEGYRNFMNKIWNSARFALPHIQSVEQDLTLDSFDDYTIQEKWMLSRLNRTVLEVSEAIETYSFNDAAQSLYQFTWHEFCDWGIEQSKIPLSGTDEHARVRAAVVLKETLNTVIRLLHPFVPFITEEIASYVPTDQKPVISGPFPICDERWVDEEAEDGMKTLMGIIGSIRNIRAEMNIAPGKALPVAIYPDTEKNASLIHDNQPTLKTMAKISDFNIEQVGSMTEPPKFSAAGVVGNIRIFAPLEGLLDPVAEISRLERELAKIEKEAGSIRKKLSNEDFLEKASPEAVQKQKDKLTEMDGRESGIRQALERMKKFCN
jgi:valyl-tRNA synthetase